MQINAIETDIKLINGNLEEFSETEIYEGMNSVSYDVHKFVISREQDMLIGGIAKEVSLDKGKSRYIL